MPRELAKVLDGYGRVTRMGDVALLRELFLRDLFALLVIGCRRLDMQHQWVLDRCDEVQIEPDGYLDLWHREGFKSSILTFGKTVQDILRNPEITIGIFSHNRPIAKGFLRPIKREFESNALLKNLFPDVLWENPFKEAPTWSEDSGIVVKRRGNPKESTVEAWGLVEGMPIGKHFDVLIIDDLVTQDNAASPDMRDKTLEAWSLALNLGKRGGVRRMVGTRYHFGDAYGAVLERKAAIPRIYPAEVDGEPATFFSREELDQKRRDQGPYVYAAQMQLDPRKDSEVGFTLEWIRQYHGGTEGNTYVVIDPSSGKKLQRDKSDYTAAWVVTAGRDGNWYVEWFMRDRLNLLERINLVMWLHRTFSPRAIGYEQYGMQADIEAIRDEQQRQRYRFDITPLGGKLSKFDRIQGLTPLFEQGRMYFPPTMMVALKETGEMVDMMHIFRREEYEAYPYAGHDDMLDALARITDPELGVIWPKPEQTGRVAIRRHKRVPAHTAAWVA